MWPQSSDEDDLSTTRALVIDGNPTSRAILINQLREFGVGSVSQCARVIDARRQLEVKPFDIVLCEQHFGKESSTGQDLLDDLRRNQLLPFSTVFIMVTSEATYAKVAEAAESALDGYLLKPHTAASLDERLKQARQRKISLKDIFEAIEAEDFEDAARLCLERFESRGKFWLYAARIGAELLLRLERYTEAQTLFEAVVAAKALPWAKLGVARAMLETGDISKAATTLERLVSEERDYADAYDVLGRAQFELGYFDKALQIYQMACDLTPHSISRLQNLGMMQFYAGDRAEAERLLGRAVRTGLDSKMFDPQSLVLLGFARFELADRKGLAHCHDDMGKLLEREPESLRLQNMAEVIEVLMQLQEQQPARALAKVRALSSRVKEPEFDFESASNLITLLALMRIKEIEFEETEQLVSTLGMRFCTTRAMGELLAGAAAMYPPYQDSVHACNAQVLKIAENAMSLSIGGNPGAAVRELLAHGRHTCNSKLIETAHLVLQRYSAKIKDGAAELAESVRDIRSRYGTGSLRQIIGVAKRQTGGMALRTPTPSRN